MAERHRASPRLQPRRGPEDFRHRRELADRGFEVVGSEDERVYLWFNDWVMRTRVPEDEVAALRREFLEGPLEVREAFQVNEPVEDGDFLFSFPVWIFRAVKRR